MLGLKGIKKLEKVSQGNPILERVKSQLEKLSQGYEKKHKRKVQEAMNQDSREEKKRYFGTTHDNGKENLLFFFLTRGW